jgi:16S rRNA (uracil1498-N3)-methyltransferase
MTRQSKHAIYLPGAEPAGGELIIEGDEARHAIRVKRIREGEQVTALDGAGTVIETRAIEARRRLVLQVLDVQSVENGDPQVEIFAPPPKGPRLGAMIDQLSQVGAARWRPLETAFATERLTAARRGRLERVAIEAMKQCRRPWLLEIGEEAALEVALAAPPGAEVVLADASGERYQPEPGARVRRAILGPEGGWREDELDRARAAGARICGFGPHVMRVETAAVVVSAALRAGAREVLPSANRKERS